jgi:phage shock protein PspC (stress-responsive transcriptional regulator)
MEKNISINISGIIFNIEEDGYDRLKRYLDEIKRYFATYDDTGEIAADIENRVAEIFLSKLNPQKQVITARDVDSLIAQMGNVQDFEAIQDAEESENEAHSYSNTYAAESTAASGAGSRASTATGSATGTGADTGNGSTASTAATDSGTRRLFRDGKRKIIAGVAAGIAHYFRVDAFWVRLFFLVILLDLFFSFSFSSVLLIGYIVLWIVVPERYDLPEDRKIKKMFRNPDDKVIGGVASGVAAYFGVDPSLIRVLFVVFLFVGGSSLIAYLILWVITPEAQTLTDRMQMQGEPVTLSNIEQNIKKNLNVREGEENALVRALLFPFRLISAVFSGVGRSLHPLMRFLGDAIRIIAGIVLILIGFSFLIGLLIALSFTAGFYPEAYLSLGDVQLPAFLTQRTIPMVLLISAFIFLFIPALATILLGAAIIAKRWMLNTAASWMLFALWIISLITLAISAPAFALDYRVGDYYETESTFAADTSQTLFLGLQQNSRFDYGDVNLTIKASPEEEMRLEQRYYARGRNRDAAMELARQSRYEVLQQGDSLLLSQHLQLPEDVPFRGQKLDATLYMPIGQKFRMDYSMRKILSYTLTPHGYSSRDLRNAPVFVFNENSELQCLDCPERSQSSNAGATYQDEENIGDFTREIKAENFRQVSAGSHYEVFFRQEEQYSIRLQGDEDAVNTVEFDQQGDKISFKNSFSFLDTDQGKVRIYISLPELNSLSLSGAAEARFQDWSAARIAFDFSGASKCTFDGEADEVEVDLSGSSELNLQGLGKRLEADLSGSTALKAMDFNIQEADLSLSGASAATVHAQDRLKVNASGASHVRYKGNPETDFNHGRAARVQKSDD